ncbi:uncharacterized protein IUM83_04754 [Phytophthora cinnamomi]|uniref:uncharacterized protein n=1 Tax=Phytophthora cinnamomi TaxID=4785 RepID=UPI00355ABDAE|nr:hypothetical protein IUM83_04754 [Phytophthora cinnamomi]
MEEENEDEHVESSSHRPFVSPITEWNIVAEDGTQALSLVFYPVEEVDDEVEKNLHADETLVLVIPGNPGNPYFYIPLMQQIVKKLGRRHDVRCLSHAGHVMPWRNQNRDFTLQEQLDQKVYYVKQRLLENPYLRLVVIGHSIGSYILLDIARQFPQQIARLGLLQPTIMHVALSRRGRQMMPLFNNYELVVMFVGMLETIIPVSLRRWIIRRAVGSKTSDTIQLASLSLVNSIVLQNVFSMGASEVSDVIELDSELVFKHAEKILFVYSAVDDWVPGEFVQEYQLRFPAARHRIVPHGHAFMMEPNGTRDTMAHISQWIGDILDAA